MGNLTHIITDVDVWPSAEAHIRDILKSFPGFELVSDVGLYVYYYYKHNKRKGGWVWWNTTEDAPMWGYVGDTDSETDDGDDEFEIHHGIHSKHPRPGLPWMYWVQASITSELCTRWKAHNPRLFDEGVGILPPCPRRNFGQFIQEWYAPQTEGSPEAVEYSRARAWLDFEQIGPPALVAQEKEHQRLRN